MMKESEQNRKPGLQVAPSPFNAVKLELAVIIVLGSVFWLIVDSITSNDVAQIGLLLLFGLISAVWLVVRTRYLARHVSEN
ncbi:MAG: hypothetical protein PVJ39_01265 [Gammaproteobacteria bacterium]|jgi:hypothetical protein